MIRPLILADQMTRREASVDPRIASDILMAWAWLHCCRTGETFDFYDFDIGQIAAWASYEISKYQDESKPTPPPLRSA